MRVFAAHGYRRARLDDVAAEAGVTKGAVYHYFADKEDLLRRALERRRDEVLGRLEHALAEGEEPAAERLRAGLHRAFGGHDPARADALALLQGIAHECPELYREWIANGFVKGWRVVASLIEEGMASGEFRAGVDAEAVARVLFTGLLGQVVMQRHAARVPAVRADAGRLVDAAVELMLAGLGAAPHTGPAPRRRMS